MTTLRVIDNPYPGELPRIAGVPWGVEPGDMWHVPEADDPDRECWAIVLPNRAGLWWTTYLAPGDPPDGEPKRWEVSGEPPKITVRPSINAEPEWHGHITNGEMTP